VPPQKIFDERRDGFRFSALYIRPGRLLFLFFGRRRILDYAAGLSAILTFFRFAATINGGAAFFAGEGGHVKNPPF
jgi:hypothetical protein